MPQKRHVVDQHVAQLRKADVELVSEKEKKGTGIVCSASI
jgi:hypothetical protein